MNDIDRRLALEIRLALEAIRDYRAKKLSFVRVASKISTMSLAFECEELRAQLYDYAAQLDLAVADITSDTRISDDEMASLEAALYAIESVIVLFRSERQLDDSSDAS